MAFELGKVHKRLSDPPQSVPVGTIVFDERNGRFQLIQRQAHLQMIQLEVGNFVDVYRGSQRVFSGEITNMECAGPYADPMYSVKKSPF